MVFKRLINTSHIYFIRHYCKGPLKPDPAPVVAPETFSRYGDNGTSKTLTGVILPKDNKIFNAIGATEELLTFIGMAREHAQESEHEYSDKLKRIQTVIIDISTAISHYSDKNKKPISPIYTKELEDWIHDYSKALPPPEQYIIPGKGNSDSYLRNLSSINEGIINHPAPTDKQNKKRLPVLQYFFGETSRLPLRTVTGGGVASASLHIARAICRRTERVIVPLVREESLDKEAQVYLNRLSDFLFTISRIAAKLDQRTESIYIPKPDEKIQAQVEYARRVI